MDQSTSIFFNEVTGMEITRTQQQFILNLLAELCSEQIGVELKFTLDEQEPAVQQ